MCMYQLNFMLMIPPPRYLIRHFSCGGVVQILPLTGVMYGYIWLSDTSTVLLQKTCCC